MCHPWVPLGVGGCHTSSIHDPHTSFDYVQVGESGSLWYRQNKLVTHFIPHCLSGPFFAYLQRPYLKSTSPWFSVWFLQVLTAYGGGASFLTAPFRVWFFKGNLKGQHPVMAGLKGHHRENSVLLACLLHMGVLCFSGWTPPNTARRFFFWCQIHQKRVPSKEETPRPSGARCHGPTSGAPFKGTWAYPFLGHPLFGGWKEQPKGSLVWEFPGKTKWSPRTSVRFHVYGDGASGGVWSYTLVFMPHKDARNFEALVLEAYTCPGPGYSVTPKVVSRAV